MTKNISIKEVIGFIVQMLKPFKFAIFIMFFTGLAWSICVSLEPYILKVIIDRIDLISSEGNAIAILSLPVCAYLGVNFIMTTIMRVYGYFLDIKAIPQLRTNIGHNAFNSITEQSIRFYQNNFAGSLANKIGDLTSAIPELLQIFMDRFIAHFLALGVAIFTIYQINYKLAIATFVWSLLFIIGAFLLSKRVTILASAYSEVGSKLTGNYVDVFSNILSLKLFACKLSEMKKINKVFDEAMRTERKLQWTYFCIWAVSNYSYWAMQAVSLYFLVTGLDEGWVTGGDFALVISLNIAIINFLSSMTKDFYQFSKHLGRVMQALNIIMPQPEIMDRKEARTLDLKNTDIVFNCVGFQYHNSNPLFDNLSVTIKSGQKVGLVGYSGSGKTTFVNLILRLYNATSGAITVGSEDISHVTQDSLRKIIAMIPQDPSLFHRSLMENIRYGNDKSSDEEVIEAAKKAHAHEFIVGLKEGYDSLVGERGVKLSGGQRQRIAIARAILKDAPILILDEATSQLDSVTENYIQDSLLELMKSGSGKTTIVIAHRLSTLLNMDRILVFDKGVIVEDGSHEELISKNGLYKKLWNAQVGGFLPEHR